MLEPSPLLSISGGDLLIEKGGSGFETLSVDDPKVARQRENINATIGALRAQEPHPQFKSTKLRNMASILTEKAQ